MKIIYKKINFRKTSLFLVEVINQIGDHDPSGIDMSRDIQERLNNLFGAEVELKRIALNMKQIEAYNPPPNPAKLTDTRCQKYISLYGRQSWELDALEPSVLNQLITYNVLQFRDESLFQKSCRLEAQYKSELKVINDNYNKVVEFLKKESLL